MTPELSPELQEMLQRATDAVEQIRRITNPECTNIAEAWAAYLTEYVYASAQAWEALQRGDETAAATHRLTATCHNARADRKHKELRRAMMRLSDAGS